jgi:pimeloyl-ACP methyl ester carboxylesterase
VPRTLTVSRVSVRPGKEAEYLAAVRELAGLAEARGWHLWVFRRPGVGGSFLEFSESRSRETHRAVAERPADEQSLEARIRAVAEYQPGAWELWEEVR